jgi:hypothetical protein
MATFRWCGTLPPLYNGEFLHRSSRDSGSLGKNTSPEKFERDRAQAGTRLGVKKYPHSTSKARTHRKFTKDSNVVKKKVFLGQIVKDVWHSNLEGGCLFSKPKGIFRVEDVLIPIELLERIKTLPEGYEQEIVDFLESSY